MIKKILIGIFVGVLVGLFFGEYVAFLSIIGDAFIGLMQMTVLPYIMISLMVNIGQLDISKSKKLIKAAAFIIVVSLFLGMFLVISLPTFFPERVSGSFFSTNLTAIHEPFDFVELYIPANPFKSLSDNVVPAVVLFSILIGMSLMAVQEKAGLIRGMEAFADALNKANKIIIQLTPIGIFSIVASTVGTVLISEIALLQIYLIAYTGAAVILSMVTIPMLISALTPFKYKEVLRVTGSTLLTIFATGKIIILLPQLIEDVNKLYDKHQLMDEDVEHSSKFLLPLVYPFPNLGTLMILIFVPFAAWFVGKPMDVEETGIFLGAGIMSSFVTPIVGIPFLLDILQIPIDIFQMFVISTVYTDRIRVVLGAVFLFGLSVLSIGYLKGILRVSTIKLLFCVGLTTGLLLSVFLPLRFFGGETIKGGEVGYKSFVSMDLLEQYDRVTERKYRRSPIGLGSYRSLSRIKKSGVIRVGYYADALPFAFRNTKGEIVGLDIEMAYALARELKVRLELIKVPRTNQARTLNEGVVDIIMSGTPIEMELLQELNFTTPYMSQTLALMVKDHLRNQYKSLDKIKAKKHINLGIFQTHVLGDNILKGFPNVTPYRLSSLRDFFTDEEDKYDALLYTAEAGSAWTLVYPQYSVVIPSEKFLKIPMAYPVAKANDSLLDYMNSWVLVKKEENFLNSYYGYWILGEGSVNKEPHWSVIRNVLHWVD
ncbi:cation:dicarboxylate symporter family transporter [Algivirga pacifica]|uniref:Cation:dicarboxylase symporter family transporter n=1 Tax=Algivirga pacifica TaxID=1162670 RepID=A0ABP9D1J5_9BACT